MSTQPVNQPLKQVADLVNDATDVDLRSMIRSSVHAILSPLASLKLTVVLLVLSVLVIWVVTLEQTRYDIWTVKQKHFPSLLVYIPFQTFFPPAWFGEMQSVPGGFFMPSGTLILVLMIVNLLAAHLVRMRIQAKGFRLAMGFVGLFVGALTTWGVIFYGQNPEGFQERPPISYQFMWRLIQIGMFGLIVTAIASSFLMKKERFVERIVLWIFSLSILASLVFVLFTGQAAFIGDSAMRILWQLIQATIASLILLAGCVLVFNRKGGMVLIHLGIGMLMFNELYVTMTNVEQRMSIIEGETVSHAVDIRSTELMVMKESEDGTKHDLILIPRDELLKDQVISPEELPFDIECVEYHSNSEAIEVMPGRGAPATAGTGLRYVSKNLPINNGVDSQKVDSASAYIRITDRESGKTLGIYLCNQNAAAQGIYEDVTVDGTTYYFALWFKHHFKDYSITLTDVEKEDYVGTDTARSYSSEFILHDWERNSSSNQRIWMNNPLRYGNETFYQSGFEVLKNGRELTSMQVVENSGWMIPYVACMIVVVGLCAQFGASLLKFLEKTQADQNPYSSNTAEKLIEASDGDRANKKQRFGWVSLVLLGIIGLYVGNNMMKASRVKVEKDGMKLDLLGQTPITYKGRIQPLDSLARNTVRQLANRETVKYPDRTLVAVFEQGDDSWYFKLTGNNVDVGLVVDDFFPFLNGIEFDGSGDPKWELKSGWESKEARSGEFARIEITESLDLVVTQSGDNIQDFVSKWYSELSLDQPKESLVKSRVDSTLFKSSTDSAVPYKLFDRTGKPRHKEPAIRWLADLIFKSPGFDDVQIVRIEDLNVAGALKLPEKRKGLKYSIAELNEAREELDRLIEEAKQLPKADWSPLQKRLYEVQQKLDLVFGIGIAMGDSDDQGDDNPLSRMHLARIISEGELPRAVHLRDEEWLSLSVAVDQRWVGELAAEMGVSTFDEFAIKLTDVQLVEAERERRTREKMIIATLSDERIRKAMQELLQVDDLSLLARRLDERWDQFPEPLKKDLEFVKPLVEAELVEEILPQRATWEHNIKIMLRAIFGDVDTIPEFRNESMDQLVSLGPAYRSGDAETFNSTLESYLGKFEETPPTGMSETSMSSETFYNFFSPFYLAIVLYLIAIVMTLVGWIGYRPMIRVGLWTIGIALAIHCLGLVLRVVISGRPPVTNLYSSFVFVSAASVLIMMIVERMTKMGIGNILAGVAGSSALIWAWTISIRDGDTFAVLQAVLDTQFWLSTHVICISLGYAATGAAGFLGIAYLICGMFIPGFDKTSRRGFGQIIYGIVCFALFFSFFGTVLGGLWGDDSWGRFWGWDPKENGALMIVFWNAVVLHARWGGMIRERGLASLVILGNVITLWSWEGVNQLGVGLHSYGVSEGRLQIIIAVAAVNCAIAALAFVPTSWWASFRADSVPANPLNAPARGGDAIREKTTKKKKSRKSK